MSYNPNSKKHKANHCGYRTKPTRTQVQATLNFFDTSDFANFAKIATVIATSEEVKPILGTQLKMKL